MIGSKFSRHFFNQWEVKPKPIVTRACTFSRALCRLRVITSSFDWFTGLSPSFLIGQSNYFGFGFTTLIWKSLYNDILWQNKSIVTGSVVCCNPCGWKRRILVIWRACVRPSPERTNRKTRVESSISDRSSTEPIFTNKFPLYTGFKSRTRWAETQRFPLLPLYLKSLQNSER